MALALTLFGSHASRCSSRILIVFDEFSDFVHLGTLISGGGRSHALEHEEGGHGGHLEHLLHLLALVHVHVDEGVVGVELSRQLAQLVLDSLAGTAPRRGELAESFLFRAVRDDLLELFSRLGVLERHLYFLLQQIG